MKKSLVLILAACMCAFVALMLTGCGDDDSTKKTDEPAATSQTTTDEGTSEPAQEEKTSGKSYDLTVAGTTWDTVKEAFNCDEVNLVNEITMVGTYETKVYDDGETPDAHIVNLYIDGEDMDEATYCDISGIDASSLPANGTMVKVHGTWKHDPESDNDYSFGFYLDSLEVVE